MTKSENEQKHVSLCSFPKTGKRGVPQQFPRRLYEMLQTESKLTDASIKWSNSGKAFQIYNVQEFTDTVLSKYFRTKKFSSFQRNLNLYGFTKVRSGPDVDMYAHPSFIKFEPERLFKIRKVTIAASRKAYNNKIMSLFQQTKIPQQQQQQHEQQEQLSVLVGAMDDRLPPIPVTPINDRSTSSTEESPAPSTEMIANNSIGRVGPTVHQKSLDRPRTVTNIDCGRLDLLALALEQRAFDASKKPT